MAEEKQAGASGGLPGASTATDRRGAARYPSSLRVVCYPASGSLAERRQARVRNVSKTGIGLHVDRRWEPGTELVVEFPAEAPNKPRLLRVRVVHATPQIGGCFLIGCQLQSPLSDEDVKALTKG